MTRALSLVAALLVVVLFGLIVRWDAGDVLAGPAKYRAADFPDLPPVVRTAVQPGPAIWRFECVGSVKDCGGKEEPVAKEVPARLAPAPVAELVWDDVWLREMPYFPAPPVHPVPEPGTLGLLMLGLLGLWRTR